MPTVTHTRNPYVVGEVTTMVNRLNRTGRGALWRVVAVKGAKVTVEPCFTVTGASGLRRKTVGYYELDGPVDLIRLAGAYVQLGNLIADLARFRGAGGEQ